MGWKHVSRILPIPLRKGSLPAPDIQRTQRGATKKAAVVTPWRRLRPFSGNSNFRLIATVRSRSKKGEAGLCCAQSCDRPKPIVIMVLPTEKQPESLIRSRGPMIWQRVLYRPACAAASTKRTGHARERTLHHNSSSRKPIGQQFSQSEGTQTACRHCPI